MQKVLAVGGAVLGVLKQLETPAIATAAAGVLAPIILGLFGDNFPPAAIAGWLVLAGGVAAALQKALAKPAPAPAPPAPAKAKAPRKAGGK